MVARVQARSMVGSWWSPREWASWCAKLVAAGRVAKATLPGVKRRAAEAQKVQGAAVKRPAAAPIQGRKRTVYTRERGGNLISGGPRRGVHKRPAAGCT